MPHLRKYKFPGAVYNDAVMMIRVFVYEMQMLKSPKYDSIVSVFNI